MRLRIAIRMLALAGLGVLGCQAIAGIQDRIYEPLEGGTGVAANPFCTTYCNEVMQACTDSAQYTDMDTCLAVCAKLPDLDRHEPTNMNTVACREAQARDALKGEEVASICKSAGPAGDNACGTGCESYCALFDAVCSDKVSAPVPNCVELCDKLLPPGDETNVAGTAMGNTLACRLYHVSAAAASKDPTEHCGHARLANPTLNCIDTDTNVDCDTYCNTVETICGLPDSDGGTDAVYDDDAQCHAVCGALKSAPTTDMTMNTVGCRTYHAWNAVLLALPDQHCPHAGPGGDGHCGPDTPGGDGNCESYCRLVQAACPTDFKDHFAGGADACMTECEKVPGAKPDSGYSVNTPDGNTVQCRLHHTAKAFADQKECAAALGTTVCTK
jgi:hypothetical protein